MVGMDQKDKLLLLVACAQVVLLVILHLALCSFPVFRPVMLDIMAGTDQKDSCLEEYGKLDFTERFYYVSVYSAMLGLRVTCYASTYGCFWEEFPTFSR